MAQLLGRDHIAGALEQQGQYLERLFLQLDLDAALAAIMCRFAIAAISGSVTTERSALSAAMTRRSLARGIVVRENLGNVGTGDFRVRDRME